MLCCYCFQSWRVPFRVFFSFEVGRIRWWIIKYLVHSLHFKVIWARRHRRGLRCFDSTNCVTSVLGCLSSGLVSMFLGGVNFKPWEIRFRLVRNKLNYGSIQIPSNGSAVRKWSWLVWKCVIYVHKEFKWNWKPDVQIGWTLTALMTFYGICVSRSNEFIFISTASNTNDCVYIERYILGSR